MPAMCVSKARHSFKARVFEKIVDGLVLIRCPEWTLGKINFGWLALLMGASLGFLDFTAFIKLLILLMMIGLFGYMVNDWSDRRSDIAVGKRNAFANDSSRRYGIFLFSFVLLSAAAITIYVCDSALKAGLVVAQLSTSFAYSHPPLRLKARGISGFITIIFSQYLIPMSVVMASLNGAKAPDWIFFLSFIGVNGACLELGHQRYDLKRDQAVGIQTFAASLKWEQITRWYRRLLIGLAAFIFALPIYISGRILMSGGIGRSKWFYAMLLLWVVVMLGVAVHRYLVKTRTTFYDPFYACRLITLDRLFTYFPNCFMLIYLAITFVPARTGDWRFAALAILWARISLIKMRNSWHLEQVRRLLLPPELWWR